MEEWVKKSDVLELLSLPSDIVYDHIYELKGMWIDGIDQWQNIIDFLLDMLEEEHMGSTAIAVERVKEKFGVDI